MAFVYLLCDSGQDNMFKIGTTKLPIEQRIKKLQTGNSNEIFLSDYYETAHPFYIEKMLHKKFAPNKKVGEWFQLDDPDALSFKDVCNQFEELISTLKDNPFFPKNPK